MHTLGSEINVGSGINIGMGRLRKNNKRRVLNSSRGENFFFTHKDAHIAANFFVH